MLVDIDFAWHTHMGISGAYAGDCIASLGFVLGHDDSTGDDRSPGSQLMEGFRRTVQAYHAKYPGEPARLEQHRTADLHHAVLPVRLMRAS